MHAGEVIAGQFFVPFGLQFFLASIVDGSVQKE